MRKSVEIEGLTYQYDSREKVLSNVHLHVPEGSIYGFLGPNGAGKTTTLKLLLGLLQLQQGSVRVRGNDLRNNRLEVLRNTGSLIETPSLYGQLTATENLEVLRKIYDVPKQRINDVLELAGLSHTGKKKAGQFSLGMKQRLSIAIALLHRPSLLVLDEPTNGLDPNGILEMRELLRRLNSEHGITILVSSHLLTEIEKLVTHIGIISKGSMAFEGTLQELMQRQHATSFLKVETSNLQRTLEIFLAAGIPATAENNAVVSQLIEREKTAALNRSLVAEGIDVYSIASVKHDLESIFMQITNP